MYFLSRKKVQKSARGPFVWGAMGALPVADEATRASGSGLRKTSLLRQAKFSQGTATGPSDSPDDQRA